MTRAAIVVCFRPIMSLALVHIAMKPGVIVRLAKNSGCRGAGASSGVLINETRVKESQFVGV